MRDSEDFRVIIFGGGRMGLSHASMLGLLYPQAQITIVEPSLHTRIVLKVIVGIRVVKSVRRYMAMRAGYAIIASPPAFHCENVLQLRDKGFTGRLLVEKPFSCEAEDISFAKYVRHGYVMRHSYFWKNVTELASQNNIVRLHVALETNQNFELDSGGWRASSPNKGEVLLEELGSHVINLAISLIGALDFYIEMADHNFVSIKSRSMEDFSLTLTANSARVRKSDFKVSVTTFNHEVFTDFYSYKQSKLDGSDMVETNLASLGVNARAA